MEAASITWLPLGLLLVEQGLLTHLELEAAMVEQEQTGKRLGEVLVARGYVTVSALAGALAEQLGINVPVEQPEEPRSTRRPVLRLVPNSETPTLVALPHPGDQVSTLDRHRTRLAEAEYVVYQRDMRIAELEEALARTRGGSAEWPSRSHVLFVPGRTSYELVEREGPPPTAGTPCELDGASFTTARLGRSPLPGDARPCAYLLRS